MAGLLRRLVRLGRFLFLDQLVITSLDIMGDAVGVVEVAVRSAVGLDDLGKGVHHRAAEALQSVAMSIGAATFKGAIGFVEGPVHSLK
ncbi:hypothetical protein ASD03_09920 [Ensifer sp. Root127]|nr:hypothetical protein ASD03_09920 [Ensifer sp. Root127]